MRGQQQHGEEGADHMRAGWASDPVHHFNGHIYAKMALNLIEKVAAAPQATMAGQPQEVMECKGNRDDQGAGQLEPVPAERQKSQRQQQ
jgi:hypothetical protein